MTPEAALTKAIEIAGGHAALAKTLGIERTAIYQWKQAPPKRVATLEQLTGVTRYDLRPDVFGEAPKRKARAA